MQTDLVVSSAVPAAGRSPATVVARRTARRAVRSGLLWGFVLGAYVATGAYTYASSYKTAAQRARLVELFGSNVGLNALVGPAHELQTVAGYTAWKYLAFVNLIGATWGLLTGTRLLRGEEDAGRWELLLAGQTTRRAAAAQALAGLAAGAATLWVATGLIVAVVGHSARVEIGIGPALFFALALVSNAIVFLAVGALAGQLAATRRQAAAYAGAVLGVSYALRMVADSGVGLDWLRWATPLGWVEQLQPLTSPHPLALIPMVALVAVLSYLTVDLAGRRDLGAATLPDRSSAPAHTRLLFGPLGLAVRLARGTFLGWAVAIVAFGLLVGVVATSAEGAITSSPAIKQAFSRLGAPGAGAAAYLGVTFLMMALLVAVIAAGQVGATRAEEAHGRLDHLLVRPVSRRSWLAGRVAVAAAAVVAGGLLAGICAWLGAASQHAGVHFGSLLAAGLNVVPPALCILGIGILVLGVRPRAASAAVYGVLAWSLLVEVLGGTVNVSHWLLDTSVFHEMAAAPAVAPNWTSAGVLVAIGAVAAAVGGIAFGRRDLQGE
jgi:ABC-2 type transport system permease protein